MGVQQGDDRQVPGDEVPRQLVGFLDHARDLDVGRLRGQGAGAHRGETVDLVDDDQAVRYEAVSNVPADTGR
jgi:hypothetical protein